jgi:hypothetical protein
LPWPIRNRFTPGSLCACGKTAAQGNHRVRFSLLCLPLSDDEDTTAAPDLVYCALIHTALARGACSFAFWKLRLRFDRQRKGRLG